jgi:drug/metabolite transporter (DMT)-like permease
MSAGSGSLAPEGRSVAGGIGLMLLAFFLFTANDALAKRLATTYSSGQILVYRSAVVLVVLAPLIARAGVRTVLVIERPWLHGLRVLCATVEVLLFYWAISVLPLADAMTFYLASPIYITVLASFFLKEAVGLRRWLAVMVGFVGVVVALRPSTAAFGGYALIAFVGSLIYAVFVVVTRSVRNAPGIALLSWQFAATLIGGAIAAPVSWVALSAPIDAALLGLLGLVSLAGMACVNQSLRLAPASVVAPYQNTFIVWAILFGYFFFGDTPGWHIVVGATIIVASCLYIFFREQNAAPRVEPDIVSGP